MDEYIEILVMNVTINSDRDRFQFHQVKNVRATVTSFGRLESFHLNLSCT